MVSPQTNIDLETMAQRLKGLRSFAICGHVSPDGDCLGSQLALFHALGALGKDAVCILAKAGSVDDGLKFLPGIEEMVAAEDFTGKADAFIACDVPTVDRLGAASSVLERCDQSFTIDHHATQDPLAQWTYTDPDVASTTMIAWELIGHLGVEANADMALCAYTGLLTDTGCFQFQNTDVAAFKAACDMAAFGFSPSEVARNVFQTRSIASLRLEAVMLERMEIDPAGFVISYLLRSDFERLGAEKSDAEPLINVLRAIKGVRVACLLREDAGSVRGSLRAKDGTDVSAIAQELGGGGHKAAAGFTMAPSIDAARERVAAMLEDELS